MERGGGAAGSTRRDAGMDSPLPPSGSLVEVSFAELDADPLGTLRRIYAELRLPNFQAVLPAADRYCAGLELRGFKKNAHRWARAWGWHAATHLPALLTRAGCPEQADQPGAATEGATKLGSLLS